jgi:hypothetical protein
MAAIIATTTLLNEARKAYHALMTGAQPRVVVDANGEKVEFTPANASKLYTYIQQLETALATPCGSQPQPSLQHAPMTFLF